MKVTSASGYIKYIPKKWADGVELVTERQLEAPKKKRLTPFERFLFAEATWRSTLTPFLKRHLNGHTPVRMEAQENRLGQVRYIVIYDEINGFKTEAIVPKKVWRVCPAELKTRELVLWL